MRMFAKAVLRCLGVLAVLAATSGAARAAPHSITWINMGPTAFGAFATDVLGAPPRSPSDPRSMQGPRSRRRTSGHHEVGARRPSPR